MSRMLKLIMMIVPLVASVSYNVKMREYEQSVTDVEYPYHDEPHIYSVNGVEYVNRTNRKPTMRLVLQEKFFQNMQKNFFNQFCNYLTKHYQHKDLQKINQTFTIEDLGTLNFTQSDFNLRSMSIGTEEPIVILGENNLIRLNLKDFKADLNSSYAYMTNPPLLADVGQFFYESNGTNLTINGTIFINDEQLMESRVHEFSFNSKPMWVAMDGVSDMSHVLGKAANYAGNVAIRRVNSLSRYINGSHNAWKIENLTNVLLAQFPEEMEVYRNLFVEGGLHWNPIVKANDYLELWFDFSMHDDRHRNKRKNNAVFKDTETSHDYEMQIYLSEFLMQSVMQALYWQGQLVLDPVKISDAEMVVLRTSIFLNWDLRGKFEKAGFDVMRMNCRYIPYMANDTDDIEPITHVGTERGFELTGQVMIDLECTPRDDPGRGNYRHVFTMRTNRFYMAAKLRIEENLLVSVKDLKLDLTIEKIEKSNIGDVDVGTVKLLIQLFQPVIITMLRFFLNNVKIPLGFLIADVFGIAWFNFDKTILEYYENYFILFTSPKFNFPDDPTEQSPIPSWLVDSASELMGGDETPIEITAEQLDEYSKKLSRMAPPNSKQQKMLETLKDKLVEAKYEQDSQRQPEYRKYQDL